MTDLLRILAPLSIWLAAFSAVYGLQGFLCQHAAHAGATSRDWPFLLLILAYGLALALQLAVLALLRSARFGAGTGMLRDISLATGWAGLAATAWTLFPTLVTSPCG